MTTTSQRRTHRSPFAVRRRSCPSQGVGGNGAAATILHLSFCWVLFLSLLELDVVLPLPPPDCPTTTNGGRGRVGYFFVLSSSWGAVHAFTAVTPYDSRAAAGDLTFRRRCREDDEDHALGGRQRRGRGRRPSRYCFGGVVVMTGARRHRSSGVPVRPVHVLLRGLVPPTPGGEFLLDGDDDSNENSINGAGWAMAAAAAATAAPATIDKDDGHADLDRFESVLHGSLRRIASAADAAVHDASAAEEVRPLGAEGKARNDGMGMVPVAAFQSLTIDFDASSSTSRGTSGNNSKTKKKPRSPDVSSTPAPVPGSLRKITGRIVLLNSNKKSTKSNNKKKNLDPYVLHVTQKYHGATDIVKNYPVDDAARVITELLEWWARTSARRTTAASDRLQDGEREDDEAIPAAVASIATEWGVHHLVGATVSVRCRIDTASGRYVLTGSAPVATNLQPHWTFRHQSPKKSGTSGTIATASASTTSLMGMGHDRTKDRKVCVEDEFWKAVGVTATRAPDQSRVSIKPDKIGKVKQCEKFVEIVDQLLQDVVVAGPDDASDGDTTTTSSVRITDLGCGKGYLTYALHSYLQKQQFRYGNVTSIGVDIRPKLVQELNRIASDLSIEGLRFEQGSIQEACLGDHHRDEDDATGGAATAATAVAVDVVIALHACDTATDDALHVALQRGADVIVTAPCCHKQLRPQINDLMDSNGSRRRSSTALQPHPLSDVLRHGIYRERTAETVTDSLRAMLLELAGYQTNVFEFVGGEHTAKNCMITAVRRRSSHNDNQEAVRNRIRTLAEFYGIRSHKLAEWMGEQELLRAPMRDIGTDPSSSKRSMGSMPPL